MQPRQSGEFGFDFHAQKRQNAPSANITLNALKRTVPFTKRTATQNKISSAKIERGKTMLITLDKISFSWEDLLANMKSKGRREPGPKCSRRAERAYKEGIGLLDLKAVYEVFDVEGIEEDKMLKLLPSDRGYQGKSLYWPKDQLS